MSKRSAFIAVKGHDLRSWTPFLTQRLARNGSPKLKHSLHCGAPDTKTPVPFGTTRWAQLLELRNRREVSFFAPVVTSQRGRLSASDGPSPANSFLGQGYRLCPIFRVRRGKAAGDLLDVPFLILVHGSVLSRCSAALPAATIFSTSASTGSVSLEAKNRATLARSSM